MLQRVHRMTYLPVGMHFVLLPACLRFLCLYKDRKQNHPHRNFCTKIHIQVNTSDGLYYFGWYVTDVIEISLGLCVMR